MYRTSYTNNSDSLWPRFRARLEAETLKEVADSDAPEIAHHLEWVWSEHRASLDNISTDALRERFRAWADAQQARYPGGYNVDEVSWLRLFINIDEEVLWNLSDFVAGARKWNRCELVKLVDGSWEAETDEGDYEPEPIEGCRRNDVGWMRVDLTFFDPELHMGLDGYNMAWDDWYYRRPPHILRHELR